MKDKKGEAKELFLQEVTRILEEMEDEDNGNSK